MPRLLKLALVAPTLVLAHQLVFLARYGSVYGEALAHAGHGPAWTDAVAIVAIGTALLLAGSGIGIVRLARQLRREQGRRAAGGAPLERRAGGRALVAAVRRTALLVTATLVGLTIQENLERAAAGLPMPGLGILVSREYPFAVPIVVAVSIAVAITATLLTWRRAALVARLGELRARAAWTTRAPRGARRRAAAGPLPPRHGQVARQLGRRAPPHALPA